MRTGVGTTKSKKPRYFVTIKFYEEVEWDDHRTDRELKAALKADAELLRKLGFHLNDLKVDVVKVT